MEGLQTSHHMACELDIDGKPLALRFQRATTFSTSAERGGEGKRKIHSYTHRPYPAPTAHNYKALFFLNIGLKLKLTTDTLL